MNSYGSSTHHWDQNAIEEEMILNPNNGGSSHVRQIASRPESVSSFMYDEDALRASVTDLSLERRPVQHPAGTNSDESLEPNSLEISHEEGFISSSVPQYHENSLPHPGLPQQNGVRNGYPRQFSGPMRQPMHPDYHLMQMMHQPHQMSHEMHQYVPGPSRQNHPSFPAPNYHNHAEMYPSASHLPPSQRAHPSQASAFVHVNPELTHQQRHLDNGFQSDTSNIGLQESLSGIQPPAPVHSEQTGPNRPNPSPVHNQADTSTDFSDAETKESSHSDYFMTMQPSFEERERNRDRVPQPNQTQTSRNQTPGRTTSTQPYNSPAPTQSGRAQATPTQPPSKQVKVFITYATECSNQNHTRTVVQISQTLLRNSIDVAVDVLEETIRSMSSSEWLDTNISQSDFLLICVSPSYRDVVEGQSTSSQSGYHENEKAVNTQYIYRRIHAEYIRNGSKNYRFIPVLVSGAELKHIPPWLRDTRVFEWPKDYEDIIFRLFRKERFIKPKPGPPPKHTIERYSSYNERKTSRDSDKDNRSHTEPKRVS